MNNKKGFTLIELLLVIGIIAILAGIVIVAINPTKQLADSRDAQRRSDVNTILNGVYQYSIDNNGGVTDLSIPAAAAEIEAAVAFDLCELVPDYLTDIPLDPVTGDEGEITANCDGAGAITVGENWASGYNISVASGRVTVAAPAAENATITVTR